MMKKSNGWLSFFTKPILMTIIIALLAIIGLFCVNTWFNGNFYAESIIAPILTSIIAAVIVSLTIDIKKQVSGIQNMIIDTFTSNSFLEKLTDERLQDIRSNAITEMHKQRYPNMQKGLMDKDKEIFSALMHPYYEIYRETAIYYKNKNLNWNTFSSENGTKVLYRTVNIQYTIKSPTMDSIEDIADISIRKCVQTPIDSNNEQTIKKIFNLSHFYISVDGAERFDIKDDIKYEIKQLESHSDYYSTSVSLLYDGTNAKIISTHNNLKGIFVKYEKSIKVEIDYEIYLPIEDNHFTNRLKYPAKSFRIDCICNDDDNVRLYGELLGTFTENSKIKISHPNDNVISIEAFDWLLPRNGVFVILCEKTTSIDRM